MRSRFVSLSRCPNLDEAAFCRMAKKCVGLTALSLAKCGECVTDRMVEAVGRSCRLLQDLNLTEAVLVGGSGLGYVVRGCRKLVTLTLSGCHRVDDEALIPFKDVSALLWAIFHGALNDRFYNRSSIDPRNSSVVTF